MMYFFDIEGDALLEDISCIHCVAAQDAQTGEVLVGHDEQSIIALCEHLRDHDVIGHNLIGYDCPAIKKVLGIELGNVVDTLVWARLACPDIYTEDAKRARIPTRLWGSHSLEAWGQRLGQKKVEFHDWSEYSDEMLAYCIADVDVTKVLYQYLLAQSCSDASLALEHEVAAIIERQTQHGVLFDVERAWKLYDQLFQERYYIDLDLQKMLPPRNVLDREFVPKRDNISKGYRAGELAQVYKEETFNPASRSQIASRLIQKYAWEPKEFTPTGRPKVDEAVLKKLPWEEARLLADRMLLSKRIGQLMEGKKSWISHVGDDGRIHGRIITNGTVTGRMTHHSPNMSQVPAVRSRYGMEMRSLFTVPAGYSLVGADASGLELRLLAHYLHKYDGGAYAREILEGDVHSNNQQAAGLPSRDSAKQFIYALIYGAGDAKLGEIVGKGVEAGRSLRKSFEDAKPAFQKLRKQVLRTVRTKGYIRGLDRRKIPIRSEHSALNALLQSAGAVVMKQALVMLNNQIRLAAIDAKFVLNSHDEFQLEVLAGHEDIVGWMAVSSIVRAGEYFGLHIPLDAEYKVGNNWSETH